MIGALIGPELARQPPPGLTPGAQDGSLAEKTGRAEKRMGKGAVRMTSSQTPPAERVA
jgi:hypothetical protein